MKFINLRPFEDKTAAINFTNKTTITNLKRIFYLLIGYFPFNIIDLYFTFEHKPCIVFLPYVILRICISIIYVILYPIYLRKLKQINFIHRSLLVFFISFVMITQAIMTYYNYIIRNTTFEISIVYLVLSLIFYCNTLEILIPSLISIIIFTILLLTTGNDSFKLLPHITSAYICLVIGFIFSRIIWITYRDNYIYLQTISKQKYQLEELNSNLEQKVKSQVSLILKSERLKNYLPSQLVDSVLNLDSDTQISTERRKLTIFFSDIKDFTLTTDSMESEELLNLLNNYLSEMTKIALKWGGTIDKFIGDAIMIFFGAPNIIDDKTHAINCVKMAIEMQKKMKDLQSKWFNSGIEKPLSIRIGINTGVVTVGNVGTKERLIYTAIGQHVNIASRLEHECSPDSILISHSTHALVKDEIKCSEVKTIKVKGIQRDLLAYEVLF